MVHPPPPAYLIPSPGATAAAVPAAVGCLGRRCPRRLRRRRRRRRHRQTAGATTLTTPQAAAPRSDGRRSRFRWRQRRLQCLQAATPRVVTRALAVSPAARCGGDTAPTIRRRRRRRHGRRHLQQRQRRHHQLHPHRQLSNRRDRRLGRHERRGPWRSRLRTQRHPHLAHATVSGNTAAQGGRGVYLLGDGSTANATATITNSIIGQSDTLVTDFVAGVTQSGTTTTSGAGQHHRQPDRFQRHHRQLGRPDARFLG